MVSASELHEGMVVRIEGQVYKVLDVESKAGAAKMGGVVKAKLINVKSSRLWEPHFRPQERLEDLELERHTMEFLYAEDTACTFMRPDTFEQLEIPNTVIRAKCAIMRSSAKRCGRLLNSELGKYRSRI